MAHRLVVGVFLCLLSLVSAASRAQTITFVDQGAPATVLLDGGPARIRVVDPAANTSPGRDSVAVTVSSSLAGDFESLTLLETGPGTGVFEGSVTLYPAGSSAPPVTPGLATATSAGAQPSRDTLQATYPVSGATATAGLVGSILRFVDDWGRESASFAAGHVLNLRVRDQMRNDHRTRDSFTVTFTSQAGGDSEMVLVKETGMSTGVFEGILSTTRTASSPGNGQLRVATPDTVTAALAAQDGVTSSSAQAQIARSVTRLLDSEGKPADSYLEKARVRIQVVDPAVSGSSVTVQVTSGSGDSESLILPGGFGFEREIATAPTFSGPVPGDGVLQIQPYHDAAPQPDTVTATYAAGGSSDSAPFVSGRLSFVDARGRETSSLPLGSEAHARFESQGENTPSLDTVVVRLTNQTNLDEEYLVLTETRRDSGVFTGSLPLDQLSVQTGDQISARRNPLADVFATVTDRALEFLNEQGEPTDEIVESGPARVRMHSTLDNGNPSSADSAAVEMRVLLSNDLETLTLTETGPDTDVFEGTIRLEMGSFGDPDGKLQTANTGPPDYRQDEVMARSGEAEATARTIGARIEFLDAYGRKTTSYAAGETVHLRIFDPFKTLYGDSFQVTLVALGWNGIGDSETVTLQETGPDTAVFTGSIPTAYNGPSTVDGKLGVDAIDQIEVRHVTSFNPIEITRSAAINGSSILFVDAAGQPVEVYLESTQAYLRVVSATNNFSPASYDTLSVQLLAELSQDAETVQLDETGPNTGVFQGSIKLQLKFNAPSPNNGILETTEAGGGSSEPHEFDTLRATFQGGPSGPVVARAGLTGSRTWFGDAAGAEVLSYVVGATAHVWVEDQNFNTPGQSDQVQVQVRTLGGSDQEQLELRETSRDSGIFHGTVELVRTLQQWDGKLYVSPGDQIEATHQDAYGATASSAVADIAAFALEIIDEEGNPTSELLERGDARVRVFSVYGNFNPGVADVLTVSLETRNSLDQESLYLVETGPDTSVFEGSMQMAVGSGQDGNGTLETMVAGFPFSRQDEVTARYDSASATAAVISARIVFLDAQGRAATTYTVGESARVRVTDQNRNDPGYRESYGVTIASRDVGDSEWVMLEETGFDTGVFEGTVRTVFGGTGAGDGRLGAYPEDRIEARYHTANAQGEIVAAAAMRGNSVAFIDAAGQPATVYLESSRAFVRVRSAYSNTAPWGGPSTVESIQVQLTADLSQDGEMLALTETGPDTGTFEGSIQLRLGVYGIQPGNGILEVVEDGHPQYDPPHQFDTLQATYSDAAGSSTARIGLTGSRTWFANAAGAEVLAYPVGGTAWVRVEDPSYNTPGQWDRVQVQVRSESTGEQELMELLETTRDSGIFAGSLQLVRQSTQPNDRRLFVDYFDQIEAVHPDAYGATASSARADILYATIELLDEAGQPTAELVEGATARVRMFNANGNYNPSAVDSTSLQLKALRSMDDEPLTLTETGPDTGVFEGSVPMRVSTYADGNGILETLNSGSPEYLPEEVTAFYSTEGQATAKVLGARVRFFDAHGRETSSFAAGQPARVRVVDHNRNSDQSRDLVSIAMTSRDGGDSETLTLMETGFNTGVFEGSLPTVFGGPGFSPSDGQLRVYPQDQVTASYVPAFDPNPIVAQAAVAGNAVLFIDSAGQPATVYIESSRAYVRVVSSMANMDSGSVQQVPVQILAELSQDSEALTLTETGPNTGVFEGSIQLRLGIYGVQPGNGILETIEDGHAQYDPPHEFDTLRVTYSDPAGESVARIGLTGSRTWFANATGAEVSSYPTGGTAWVRVEDQNLNTPGQWDRVQVLVRSESTGEQESLELLETTRDSGIFAGSLQLARQSTQPNDRRLFVDYIDHIEATHPDAYGATVSSARADIIYATLELIDESGEATTELVEGGRARVRMFNAVSNYNPSSVDTASLQLTTLHSGDQEPVSLTETGPDTGVFEGSIAMGTGPGTDGDGTLQTLNSGSPEYRPEEVTAEYGPDGQVTARVLGARVRFFDAYGRETSSFAAGQPARVRVVDHNRNSDQSRDLVSIAVTSRDGGDSETLTLVETGFNTGVFEGSLPTVFGGPGFSPSDGQLRVYPQDQVTASYVPAFDPNPIVSQAAVTGNAVLFIDAAGQPATVFLESSRAYVRVVSSMANMDSGSVQQVPVQILAELSQDSEALTLTETGPNTGIFEGSIQLRLGIYGVQPGNGILETIEDGQAQYDPPHEFDTLRVTYSDPAGESVARIGLTGSRTWFADETGREVLSFARGETVWVRVEDHNYDTPGQWDRVQVRVRSHSTGEQEILELLETTRDSGIFAGPLQLTNQSTQPNDGRLFVDHIDKIEADHPDAYGATFSSAVADIIFAAMELIDESGETTAELVEGGRARVRMSSANNNYNASSVDTASIQLTALYSGDQEPLTLTETGPDTGVFEGSLAMEPGPGTDGDGTLQTLNSGSPEYRPEEVTATYGPDGQVTARVLGAQVRFFDAFGRETSAFAAGQPVRVRVVDHNRNSDQTRDILPVLVTSRDGGDSEPLTLLETGFDTAVFEGSLPTVFGGPGFSPSDGQLRVYPQDQVSASYLPAFDPNALVARAAITGNAVLFVDAAGQPATVYLESSRAYVRVVSSAINTHPGLAEQVPVQLLAELSQDSEHLMLTETGPNTGVFAGSIKLRLGTYGIQQGNGTLETIEDGNSISDPPHEFDTLRATYSDPAGESVARIGLTGSRTWFANAAGVEVLSFPAGGTAWIRVEDQNYNTPGQWDRVQVHVQSQSTGEQEFLELLETTRDSGIFAGPLQLTNQSTQPNDGRLFVDHIDKIEADHPDAYGATFSSAVASIIYATMELIDESGEATAELVEGGRARVRMFNANNNYSSSSTDTASIQLTALRSGDQELLTLTETGPDTGVFEGSLAMETGPGTDGDGTLQTLNSGSPEYRPEEVTAAYSAEGRVTARVLGARVRFLDAYGREASGFAAGEPVRVRVVDHNRNSGQARDIVNVTVTSRDGLDSETLTLLESGLDTAVFEGALPTVFGGPGASPSDGQLRVYPGDEVAASYVPAFDPNAIVAKGTITGNAVLFVDAAGQPATVYLESSWAYIRVVSPGSNTHPGLAQQVPVQLLAELSQDSEPVMLTETGPSSGIFEGSIQLRRSTSGPQPGNGILETAEDGHPLNDPPHERDTVRASYSDPAGDSVARIGLTGSRTWFIDAQGAEALSFPANGVAYLRVEDHNVDTPGTVDQATVRVRSLSNPDEELVTLTETGPDTGLFQGSLQLSPTWPSGAGDGSLSVQPGQQIEVTHEDAGGATASSAVAGITDEVIPENQAPTPMPDTATTPEDVAVSLSVLANDTDPDQDALDVVAITQPATGTAVLNADDTVTYTPSANASGEAVFSYTVRDPDGLEATATVTVTITPVNDVPVANADTATVAEDGSVSITVLGNDSDPENNALDVVSVSQGAHGAVTLNADETVTYTPAANYHGADAFTYTVSDGNGGTATATVTVAVTPVNDAPLALADGASVAEDGSVTVAVLGNDSDPDTDALDVTAVTQGTRGTVTLNGDDTVTYAPGTNFAGTDTFTYTISDGNGGTATATVTVSIIGDNDAPTASPDSATVAEDGSVSIAVLTNDSDPDDDVLNMTAVTQGAHGTVTIEADNTITYEPAADYHGADSFTYTINDGNGGTALAVVSLTVTPVNDDPAAADDQASGSEDGTVAIAVLGNDSDADDDPLTIAAVTQGSNGAVAIQGTSPDQTVIYTPNANFNGTDSFTYTIEDGKGGTATATVTVSIGSENDSPVAVADSASGSEDGAVVVTVLGNDSDPENHALDVLSVTLGANGSAVINADETVTYTPDADFHGTDSFTYTIGDGNGGTATATVTVTVASVNDTPVANDDAASVAEDGSVSLAVLTNDDDADGDPLTLTAATQGANGSVAIDGPSVIYTPNANFNGTDTFTYTVEDGNGGTATASVAITVTSGNDGPVAGPDNATVAEDGAVTVTVLANDSDPESDPLQVTSITQGADGTVAIGAGGTVTYTPDADFHGADSFTYTIEDGNGGTATTTVTVTVTPVNDVPVANADAGSVAEDGSVSIAVLTNDDDADGDTLSVTAVTQGANGSVSVNPDKTITYAPNPNFQGSDAFTYTVSDGNGGTATASVAITVTSVNDAPVANPNTATTPEDSPVIVAILADDTDADGDTLQVASVTQGTRGTVSINPDRTVTYTPNADVSGSDSFTYTVADGNGGTATATMTLTVTAVNDAPVAINDTVATTAEVLVNVTVLGNDVDVDGPTLTVTSVTQPAHGTAVVNADQTIRYTPASGYKGSDAFTYTVADGAGGTATATVTMTVNAPPRVTGNLQVLYDLNEGSGSTVTDSSGTGTPLNLTVSNPAAVSWISGGLSVNSATLIQSAGAATKVITACQASNAITIEAWVAPDNTSQTGLAPLVSISQASNKRNVTFGQSGNRWDGRLRTTNTNQAGNTVQTAVGTVSTALTHVVYTRDSAGNIRIYVNGVQSTSSTLTGNFSGWVTSYKLGLANELSTGSPWLGDLYLVAIYSRALSGTEVRQNWLAGQ